MNEEISRQLREAAEAHQPDRGRMLARVERGMAAATVRHRRPGIARSWQKVTLAGLAAAGVLAVAGVAAAVMVPTAPPPPDTASTLTVPHPSSTPGSTPSAHATGSSAPPSAASGESRPAPGVPNPTSTSGSKPSDGPLSSKGSIDPNSHTFWSQSALTLDTARPLTALTVQLRFALSGGVRTAGQWQTGPADDFTVTVQEIDGALVYRWDLKPGRSVPAGQHIFAAQYNHTSGTHDAKDDRYGVLATAGDGDHAVWGGFAPAK